MTSHEVISDRVAAEQASKPQDHCMRTSKATTARREQYDVAARAALPHIQAARAAGAKCARDFAAHLNGSTVPGPTNGSWSESAVLRCLRHLRKLGLDEGSEPFWIARTKRPRGRRISAAEAMASLARGLPGVAQAEIDDVDG